MRQIAIPVFALALALGVAADDTVARPGPWAFRPGQTYTYEAKTEFTYSNGSYTVKTSCGYKTGEKVTHQFETLSLKATVTAVGDDGAARISFEVLNVLVEATDGEADIRANWDSRGKELPQEGYLRWASLVGHKFEAIIAADGAIREFLDPDWPTNATKSAKRPQMEVKASMNHRDPTSKKAWLELIFSTAPRAKAAILEFHLPLPEKMDFSPDGRDNIESESCARMKFDTQEHPANPADAIPKVRHKRGESWWSAKRECTAKVDVKGVEEAKLYKAGLMGTVQWVVTLKEKGVVDLTPPVVEEGKATTR